jgi:hypothetical protein
MSEQEDKHLPADAHGLVKFLDELFPVSLPSTSELVFDADRVEYAKYLGKRELIDMLKSRMKEIA